MTETNPYRTRDAGLDTDPAGARLTVLLASAGFFLITLNMLIANVNMALAQIERELGTVAISLRVRPSSHK